MATPAMWGCKYWSTTKPNTTAVGCSDVSPANTTSFSETHDVRTPNYEPGIGNLFLPFGSLTGTLTRTQIRGCEAQRGRLAVRREKSCANYKKGIAAAWSPSEPRQNFDNIVEPILDYFELRVYAQCGERGVLSTSYPTLAAACLVSRMWLAIGRIMYRRLFLCGGMDRVRRLIRCVTGSPGLGELVQQLRLDSPMIALEPLLVGLFPNATKVWYEGPLPSASKVALLGQLFNVTHFVYDPEYAAWSPLRWRQILEGWPALRIPEFRGSGHEFDQQSKEASILLSLPTLPTLIWHYCKSVKKGSIPPLQPHTIRTVVLKCTTTPYEGALESLFEQQGNSLRRLEIGASCKMSLEAVTGTLHKTPRLQSFTFLNTRHPSRPRKMMCSFMHEKLCVEVTTNEVDCTPATVMDFLRQRSSGPLETLKIHVGGDSASESQWREVEDVARILGVTFRFETEEEEEEESYKRRV